MLIIWLSVIYRTLGRGVFFCRRCGGDRAYRHRTGRRYITVYFIPLVPLMKTGAHVQCLTCKTRYVTEVLKLPTTDQMQVALLKGMRSMVAIILRAGDPASPLSRRRALDAVTGAGEAATTRTRSRTTWPSRPMPPGPGSARSAPSSRSRRASGASPRRSGSRWRTAR